MHLLTEYMFIYVKASHATLFVRSYRLTGAKAIQRLNTVISNTMQWLTGIQRQNKISLNPNANKMSFVSWDRLLVAFRARQLFVWDVRMADSDSRALILTDSFQKPANVRFTSVVNINYVDANQLPLIAKMLQNLYQSEKTKYLGKATAEYRLIN